MWENPCAIRVSTFSAEMSPRSATTGMRLTPKRSVRSASTAGSVEMSAVWPAKTWWAMGMPSPVQTSPSTTWGRSERWSRENPKAREGKRAEGRVEPSK